MNCREPKLPGDDEAYEAKLKELLPRYHQADKFHMDAYRDANDYACTTRFSKVATRCLGGDWIPLMEWAIETAQSGGMPEAVALWFKVTTKVKKEWIVRKGHYDDPLGPKRPFSE